MLKIKKIKKEINRKSILFIGIGDTYHKINTIEKIDDITMLDRLYGENSQLAKNCLIAYDIGVDNIFAINCKRQTDYLQIMKIISQYNFDYIVPLNLNLSDTYLDMEQNKQVFYIDTILNEVCYYSDSIFIVTDKHASLFEDLDDYMFFLKNINNDINKYLYSTLKKYGRNLIFVSNNLYDYENANTLLASLLYINTLDKYIEYDFGKAVFDFFPSDFHNNNIVFFQNNDYINTSIENLNNFRQQDDLDKDILVDQIIRYIINEADFSMFEGKFYNDYIKYLIYQILDNILRKNLNNIIWEYNIDKIEFVYDNDYSTTGVIQIYFSIVPINYEREIEIILGV